MRDAKVPTTQVDVVEIMKKIRQNAASNRAEMTMDERVRREAKSEFLSLVQNAQVPDFLVEELRQKKVFEAYDPRTLYSSSRPGVGSVIGLIRKILRPITKLFINLDPLAHDVNRLTLLNNFYLTTIQDLIGKTAKLSVEVHSMRRGQHHSRDGNQSRQNHRGRQHHRRFSRDRYSRRDNENRSGNSSAAVRPPSSSEEPPAQNS
jgi:hypothetical protein